MSRWIEDHQRHPLANRWDTRKTDCLWVPSMTKTISAAQWTASGETFSPFFSSVCFFSIFFFKKNHNLEFLGNTFSFKGLVASQSSLKINLSLFIEKFTWTRASINPVIATSPYLSKLKIKFNQFKHQKREGKFILFIILSFWFWGKLKLIIVGNSCMFLG